MKLKESIAKLKFIIVTIQAFTLLELLAVLIILSALSTIAVALFFNKGAETNRTVDATNKQLLINQAQSYMWQENVTSPTFDIMQHMLEKGYLKEKVSNPYKIKAWEDKSYIVSLKANGKVGVVLTSTKSTDTVNRPELTVGMKPVYWNGTDWVEAKGEELTNGTWYKYNGDINNTGDTNKNDGIIQNLNGERWANVMLKDGSMFVWIPRYTYKIDKVSNPPRIYIKYSHGIVDDESDGFLVHPAFKLGDDELTGFWCAKFEASPREGVDNHATNDTNGDGIKGDNTLKKHVQVKPNVSSWRSIYIGKMFTVCRNMEKDPSYGWDGTGDFVDTHLMKNVEWGAVAYLTEAIRDGEEIWVNNYWSSGNTRTGSAAKTKATTVGLDAYAYNENLNPDYTGGGARASTTGEIHGIYDMSGGAADYVSAYIDDGSGDTHADDDGKSSNGIVMRLAANRKYVDVYPADTSDNPSNWDHTNMDNARDITLANFALAEAYLGGALNEITIGSPQCAYAGRVDSVYTVGGNQTAAFKPIYADYSIYGWGYIPFIQRGSYIYSIWTAGIFAFQASDGWSYGYDGFRPCIAVIP